PLMRPNYNSICFSLYYFAQSANSSMPAFQVQLVDLSRKKTTSVQVNGASILYWKKFETEFSNLPAAMVIQIVGSNTSGVQSDIRIDDIKITQGSCGGRSIPTTTTPVPMSEKKLDCTFDNGQCNWKFDPKAWKVGSFKDRK